ncbi:MAG: GNAT family N-acetyltransferase [Anaerolineaceae bacterium]|nr:GNAT family N-acetyltransferase [Anaerolineaceae bacterium]
MIKEYDGSLQNCQEILNIDKEAFNEIHLDAQGLQKVLKRRGTYRVFIDYREDKATGFMGLMYASTPHYDGLWVDLLATRPQYRRQGIATELTRLAMQIAKEEGLECVTAIVRPANQSSMAVFDKLGFSHSAEDFTLLSKNM